MAKSTLRSKAINTTSDRMLYEWCCNPNSKFNAIWPMNGAAVRRGPPAYDLSRRFGQQTRRQD
eukprot:4495824-Pyramimonas_sp.AAC.1